MFERFTNSSRRAIVMAQEEARLLNHNYIGTEHILLGLLAERECTAARSLALLNVTLQAARDQVREIIGEGQQETRGHIPFTPRAKKVLELSLREALSLHSDTIGTEHLLLGLITEGDGVGAQILERLGAPAETVRETVLLEVAGAEPDPLSAEVPIEASVSRWPGTTQTRIEALNEVRDLLRSVDRRLSAIEQHLGTTSARDEPTAPDLLRSVDRRLSAIEQNLGVTSARDEPTAPDPGELGGQPAPAPPEDPPAAAS
jgi:ATP-dependent Clp protease ATP-binding subunit ClpA